MDCLQRLRDDGSRTAVGLCERDPRGRPPLADPSRRRIVEVLRHGERAVNDIVAELDIHQSGVSRHLRLLNEAGIVKVRPAGPQRFYSLRPEGRSKARTRRRGRA